MLTRLMIGTALAVSLAGCMDNDVPRSAGVSNNASQNEPVSGDPAGAEAGELVDRKTAVENAAVTGAASEGVSDRAGPNEPVSGDQGVTDDTPMVGGAPMFSNKTIVENASQANNLTTLVAAVQAADLVDTLSGDGPFTVFAPTNDAFDRLPAGTVDTLLQPANKGDLQNVLTYHVVPGTYDAATILAQKGDALSTTLPTAQGGALTINAYGDDVYVIDSKGNAARVLQSDVYQSNGVVHVIDTVLLP